MIFLMNVSILLVQVVLMLLHVTTIAQRLLMMIHVYMQMLTQIVMVIA